MLSFKAWLRLEISSPGGLLAVALVLAAVTAGLILASYPLSYVSGTHPFWQNPSGDLAHHSSGANYFIRGPWGYPLFHVPALGIPGGTAIVYTDCIPLMALLFRVVRQITGEAQLYFSFWVFAAALLQAPSFSFALYAAGVRNLAVLFLGGLIALFTPVWLFAFSHVQLFGHFIVLLAIALYFLALQRERGSRVLPWFGLLTLLAMTVSGYMFVMVGLLFGLAILGCVWNGRLSAARAVLCLTGVALGCSAVIVGGGYLGTPVMPKNYGLYSLNLLGFVVPQLSGLVPGLEGYLLDATGGQKQGFAYLGLGVLAIVALALFQARSDLRGAVRADPTLLFGGGAILLLATSYNVYAGQVLIAGIDYATVRPAFFATMTGATTPWKILAGLSLIEQLRLVLLVVLAGALPAGLALMAWRQGKTQFLWLLALLFAASATALLLSPTRVIFAVATLHNSGRFGWVLVYLIMVLGIAALARRMKPVPLAALLGLVLALQVIDTGPVQTRLREEIEAGASRTFVYQPAVEAALAGAERFIVTPTFHCANIEIADDEQRRWASKTVERLEFLASKTAVPINSVKNARLTRAKGLIELPDCAAERQRALAGDWSDGTVYFFLAGTAAEAALARPSSRTAQCEQLEIGVLCSGSDPF